MALASTSTFVVVSNIHASGALTDARYFIIISLGTQALETTKVKPYHSELEWATPMTLAIGEPPNDSESLDLSFELHSIPKDSVFRFSKKTGDAISVGKSSTNLTLNEANPQGEKREVIFGDVVVSCQIRVSAMEDIIKKDLDDASQSTQAISQHTAVPVDVDLGKSMLENVQTAFDAAQPFLEKFEAFVTLMDKLTKVHPYVNAAWVVLSAIPKIYIRELSQNKHILDLLDSLKETYKYIIKDENLQQLDSQNIQDMVTLLADHTRECAYFIQSFASRSHRSRIIETVFASPEKRIDSLFSELEELRKKLTALLTQAAAVGAMESKDEIVKGMAFVGKGLEDLSQKIDLNDIPYAGGVSYNKKKCCLPDTRTSIRQQIRDWIDCFDEEESEKVFLLTGVAGSGKSSIAHSISDHYNQINRLGSSFFFDFRSSDPPGGDKVFSTIARDIADTYPLFKATLAKVADTRRVRQTKQPSEQLQSFIIKPFNALADSDILSVGPVLIVIDALNECPEESKEELIQTLVDDLSKLPPNFRVLITSQPDDVQDLIESNFVRHFDLSSIGFAEAEADIRLFIQQRLTKVARRLDDPKQKPHHQDWLEQLVQRSEELFIWAETACKQIASPKTRAPSKVLDDILKNGGSGIDDLYTLALQRAIGEDSQSLADFKSVMSRLMILKLPMSVNDINFMQSHVDGVEDFPSDISFLIAHLGSLLGGALDFDEHIHFLHSSFLDFLLDKKRSGPFCIDDDDDFAGAHFALAKTCAAVLTLFENEDDPKLAMEENARPIAYSYLVARHMEQSGDNADEGIWANLDSGAMDRWIADNNFRYDGLVKEVNTVVDGANFLAAKKFNPVDYLAKLQASPPNGYSWTVALNDQNATRLRSRFVSIVISEADQDPTEPMWSTSVYCLSPNGCLDSGQDCVAFLSPQNTILIWSATGAKYLEEPIKLGEDVAVQVSFNFGADFLSVLTSERVLVIFEVATGESIGRVFLDPPKGLPTCFDAYFDLVLLKFQGTEESFAFDCVSAETYSDIDAVTRLTPSDKDWIVDAWAKGCRYDVLL